MSKFKVGDAVVRTEGSFMGMQIGSSARVTEVDARGMVKLDKYAGTHDPEYLELLQGEPAPDAISPNYYLFPGGVWVRQISEHLTSNGGQALQYIARSTRLDGNNKGEPVENLRKAIKFLEWEIDRLEAL